MKRDMRIFLNKSLVALTMLTGVLPAFLLLGAGLCLGAPILWYLFPCAAYVLGILSFLIADRYRALWTAFSALLLIAGAILFVLPGRDFTALGLPLAAVVFLCLLPIMYHKPLGEEWSFAVWAVCLLLHLTADVLTRSVVFAPLKTPLKWAFAAFALCGSLMINYMSLRVGMGDESRPPKAIRRRNAAATLILYVAALAFSLWDTLAKGLNIIADFFKRVLAAALEWLARFLPDTSSSGGSGGGMDLSGLSDGEVAGPSAFALFMEKVMIVIAIILGTAAILFFLYIIGKKLVKAIKKALARLREYAASVNEGYTDQAESTFDFDQMTKSARERIEKLLRRRERPAPWKQLDGRARVRRLYRDYLQRRPAPPAQTARETLTGDKHLSAAQEFSDLYERARYSDHEIDPAAADALRDRVSEGKQ